MEKWIFTVGFGMGLTLMASVDLKASTEVGKNQGNHVSGVVMETQGDTTIVRGTINRNTPYHRVLGAHVHVELVDGKGRVLADKVGQLPPTAPKRDASRNYRSTYSVEFPAGAGAQSSHVEVKYVSSPHSGCKKSA